MSPEDILEHKTRKVVYNYITAQPGVSFGTIRSVFVLAEGTLRYHLNYLEKHGKVKSEMKGSHRCYYPLEGSATPLRPFYDFDPNTLTPVQRRILGLIQESPGITTRELDERTGLGMRVLQYNIRKLKDDMLVWKTGSSTLTGYEYVTPERLQSELMRVLIADFLHDELDEKTYEQLKEEIKRKRAEM